MCTPELSNQGLIRAKWVHLGLTETACSAWLHLINQVRMSQTFIQFYPGPCCGGNRSGTWMEVG